MVFEAATRRGSFRASKWAPTWYVWADTRDPFYGQPLDQVWRLADHKKGNWSVSPDITSWGSFRSSQWAFSHGTLKFQVHSSWIQYFLCSSVQKGGHAWTLWKFLSKGDPIRKLGPNSSSACYKLSFEQSTTSLRLVSRLHERDASFVKWVSTISTLLLLKKWHKP